MFCRGMCLAKIEQALKPEWPAVSARVLKRLEKLHGWERARASYLKLHTDAMASGQGLLPEIILQLQRLRNQMEGRLGKLQFTEVREYRGLCEDLLWYTGKHPKLAQDAPLAVSTDVEMRALMRAMQKHAVIGPMLKKHRSELKAAYNELIAADERAKHKRGQKPRLG